jgi:choline dehydrogenase-like flavoprotein
MLSGIGDSAELSKFGIQPLVDLPSVGKNMSDHVFLGNTFEINPRVSDTLQDWLEPAALSAELALWSQNHTGPLADFGSRQIAWLRLPQTDPIFKKYRDPTPGHLSAHYEVIFLVSTRFYFVLWFLKLRIINRDQHGTLSGQPVGPDGKKFITIATNVIAPIARGTVLLASSDPFTLPLVNPNLLGSPFDMHVLVYALKAIQRFAKAKSFQDYIIGRSGAFSEANTNAELEAYARANSAT